MSGNAPNTPFHRLNKSAVPNEDGFVSVWSEELKRAIWVDPATLGGDISFDGNRLIKRSPWVGLNVGGSTVVEVLENLLFPVIEPTVLLTGSLTEYFEIGTLPGDGAIGNKTNLNALITVNDGTSVGYRFYEVGLGPSGAFTPTAGGATPTWGANYATNQDKDFKIQIQYTMYAGIVGKEIVKTLISANTEQHRFIYPIYTGMSAVSMEAPQTSAGLVANGLSKQIVAIGSQLQVTFNGTAKYPYLVIPASKNDPVMIRDNGGDDVTGSFIKRTGTISSTGSNTWSTGYKIFTLPYTTNIDNKTFTFYF